MAEIKETIFSQAHLTQQFIEFVMMQAQQASLFLGKIPNPTTGAIVKNLEAARLFIDQLEMIQEKTRGNLTSEEAEILAHILSDLRFAYVEAVPEGDEKKSVQGKIEITPVTVTDTEGKKKFSKSYGA